MAFNPSSPPGPSGPPGPVFPRRPPRGAYPTPNKDEHRINERIRVPQVRLIDEKGEQVGIVPTFQALQMARERGLDLMEISPNAQPPVCKIADYGKFKYEKKKKDHEAKKKQVVIKIKEIQLRPQTDQHDLDYKFKNARTFLEEGDKVKVTMMFRGREVAYSDQGYKIMRELAEQLKDLAMVEANPKLEGKKMIMILAPGSPSKKSGSAMPKPGPRIIVNPVNSNAGSGPSPSQSSIPVPLPVPKADPNPGSSGSEPS